MADPNPLSRIVFISIAGTTQRTIGNFTLDPAILLPVEQPAGTKAEDVDAADLRWEAIVAGMLAVLGHKSDHEDAAYYRRFVLAVKPDIKDELTQAGILQARNGSFDVAEEVFLSLCGLFPECAQTAMNLALVYDQRARHAETLDRREAAEAFAEKAFDAYKKALLIDSEEPTIHYNVGHFFLHQRSFEKARDHFDSFVKLGGHPRQVREARRIIAEIDSQHLVDRLFSEAYDAIRMGREEQGIEKILRFLSGNPRVWNAWFLLGWGYRRLSRWAEGRDAFLKAVDLHPANADTLNELAICLMELEDFEGSRARLSEALRLDPENTKIISNLGILSLRRGQEGEAEGFFRTVLDFDPEDPLAKRFLEKIQKK
jgi:Flp pilus assembly protein TadD